MIFHLFHHHALARCFVAMAVLAASFTASPQASAQEPGFTARSILTHYGFTLVVSGVRPGGPADRMGLWRGDEIVGVNGVSRATQGPFFIGFTEEVLQSALTSRGGDIALVVRRNGQLLHLQGSLKPPPRPEMQAPLVIHNYYFGSPGPSMLYESRRPTMELPPDPGIGAYVDGFIEPVTGTQYLQVMRVFPGGVADAHHIRSGEIILSVDGRRIETLPDFSEAWARAGRTLQLLVMSPNGETRVVYVRR